MPTELFSSSATKTLLPDRIKGHVIDPPLHLAEEYLASRLRTGVSVVCAPDGAASTAGSSIATVEGESTHFKDFIVHLAGPVASVTANEQWRLPVFQFFIGSTVGYLCPEVDAIYVRRRTRRPPLANRYFTTASTSRCDRKSLPAGGTSLPISSRVCP